MDRTSLKDKLLEELKLYWIIALYLAVLFGLMMVYRRLILAEVGASYLNYGFAIIQALIIAKVILIGDALGVSKRFGDRPLAFTVLYRTVLFGVLVMLFGVLEHVAEGLFHGKGMGDSLHSIAATGTNELLARVIVLVMAFVPFFAISELGRVLGSHKLWALFFSTRSAPPMEHGG